MPMLTTVNPLTWFVFIMAATPYCWAAILGASSGAAHWFAHRVRRAILWLGGPSYRPVRVMGSAELPLGIGGAGADNAGVKDAIDAFAIGQVEP